MNLTQTTQRSLTPCRWSGTGNISGLYLNLQFNDWYYLRKGLLVCIHTGEIKWEPSQVCQFQSCSHLNSKTKSSYPAAEAFSTSPPQNEVELTRIHHTITKLITGSPPLSVNAQSHHFSWLVAACSIWEASIHISTPPTHTTSLTLALGYSILIMDSCLTVSIRVCMSVCVYVCTVKQSFPGCLDSSVKCFDSNIWMSLWLLLWSFSAWLTWTRTQMEIQTEM